MSADDSLTAFAHRAAHMELRLVADRVAVEVVDALSTAGVDALVVKGATIAQRLYEPGEARGYLDCDLLIAPAALAAAGAVLTRLGFRCLRDQTLHPEAWAEPHEQLWRRRRRELVELHWRLPGVGAAPDRAWELLWGARGAVAIAGAEVAALGPAAAALHVAMHAAQHGGHLGKSLVDLGAALDRLDIGTWQEAAALARELDAVDALSAGLRMEPRGATLADRLGLPEPSPRWTLLAAGAEELGAERLLRWREARGRERLRLTLVGLFPPREQMAMFDPKSARGRGALAAAHARRLVTLPSGAVRAWRATRSARHVPGDSGSA